MTKIEYLESHNRDYADILSGRERKAREVHKVVFQIEDIFPRILEQFPINDNLIKTLKAKVALSIIDTVKLSVEQDIATGTLTKEEKEAYQKGLKLSEEIGQTFMEKYIK